MKTLKQKWLVGSVAAGLLVMGSQAAVAGIAGSQHDFTPGGRAQTSVAPTTSAEICAFCHTPHGADESFTGAPLWNKSDPGSTYSRYSALQTSSLDGAEVAIGSVSLACLSCHDGSQAMDVVVNAPGQDLGGGSYDLDSVIGLMGAAGVNNGVANLETNLQDDHPVSIEYGGVASASWPSSPAAGATFDPASIAAGDPDFHPVEAAVKNGTTTWYFDDSTVNANNNRVDKDEIRLYSRPSSNAGYVECGSCHDPHNTKDNYGGGANSVITDGSAVDFLRFSNDDSAICLTCHDK